MRHKVEKQGGNESKWHFVGQVGGGEPRENLEQLSKTQRKAVYGMEMEHKHSQCCICVLCCYMEVWVSVCMCSRYY